jgi:hypothetical protein
MYKDLYSQLKEKFDSLQSKTHQLKNQLTKAMAHQSSLETQVKIQQILLKRICKESNYEARGWIMNDYEKELEKGWTYFKVPEEPELPKQESPSKVSEKVKVDEESEFEDYSQVIVKKKRPEPPPLVPEIEDAKRLLHVLFKNPRLIWPFEEPVDPVTLNIPDYPQIVKNPMDIGTARKRLHEGFYNSNVEDFVQDIRRVFMNAAIYNDPFHQIHKLAVQCSNIFEKKLDKSKLIRPPFPLGLGRCLRWRHARILWRRAEVEEVICWRTSAYQKVKKLARNPFKE